MGDFALWLCLLREELSVDLAPTLSTRPESWRNADSDVTSKFDT